MEVQKSESVKSCRAVVRNTFLEFQDDSDEEDPWVFEAPPRRMVTDSPRRMVPDSSVQRARWSDCINEKLLAGDEFAPAGTSCLEEPEPAPSADSDLDLATTTPDSELVEDASTASNGEQSSTPSGSGSGSFMHKVVSEDLRRARELALNGGGLSGYTTVMIRHIPAKYTQQKLMREINSSGFLGKYDFLYVPMQLQSRGNRSFAFINFVSPKAAEAFYKSFHGRWLRQFRAGQPVTVAPADVQGFEENVAHYTDMRSGLSRRQLQSGHALFFKALPQNLADAHRPVAQPCSPYGMAPGVWDVPLPQPQSPMQFQVFAVVAGPELQPSPQPEVQPQQPILQQLVQRYCTNCGAPKPQDHVFCVYCGARGHA